MAVNLNLDGECEVVCVAIQQKPDVISHKPISKNDFSPPFIHNWLPVILREPLLVHQDAYFTSGSSQEEDAARFFFFFFVASLLSAPTRACIEGYVMLTQPEGNESSSDKRDLINNPSISVLHSPTY